MAKNVKLHERADEELLDAIVEFLDAEEQPLTEDDLKSSKEIFIEQFVESRYKAITEGYDLSMLTAQDAGGVFKAGFNGGGAGKRNPYPAGHVLAKIWDAGAAAAREVDAAWAKKQQPQLPIAKPVPIAKPAQGHTPLPIAKPAKHQPSPVSL